MAGEGGDRVHDGAFLSTSRHAGRDEDAGKLAYQGTFPPEVIGAIPESLSEMQCWVSKESATNRGIGPCTISHLPLSREVSKTSGNTEQECVEVHKLFRSDGRVCGHSGPGNSRYGVSATFDNRAQWEGARREKVVLVDSCRAASLRYPLFDSFSDYNTLVVSDSGYVELTRCGNHVWRRGHAPCR